MTIITIRQMDGKGAADSPNATISFDNKGQYPLTITSPLSPQEEDRLAWYFEQYLEFPFLQEIKFREARESITLYGKALFDQLFGDRKAYASYSLARKDGVDKLRFEIIGSPDFFHQFHWEALKDPDWPTPFVLEANMVRTTFEPPLKEAKSQTSPTINLLIVTARPGKNDVGYRTISKPLVESLRKAKIPVRIDILRPGTYEALSRHLDAIKDEHGQGYYHIIHFDLHGALATYDQLTKGAKEGNILFQTRYGRLNYPAYSGHKAFLFFESSKPGQSDPAEAQEIADLLLKHSIPIVVLNACQSAKLTADTEASVGSRLLEAGVQTVVAMDYSVTVSAAVLMMTELYRQLFKNQDLSRALCYARKALHDDKNREAYYDQTVELEDWMLPVVYQNGGALVEPTLSLRDFTASEEKEYWQKRSRLYHAPNTEYGFVGRDLDVLEIERRLLATSDGSRRNMLLVQGMVGSGKTTLLKHLMEWWQTTGFVEQVFYFGYDERAWNADQIMDRLAQKLLPEKLDIFRALQPVAQREMLGQKMCSEKHLLVLDNIESITGSRLAIKNTLKPDEQQEIRSFLAELLGGESMVLMGSRGPEKWLSQGEGGPMRPIDVYQLPGLDKQAATTLAERVLVRHVADPEKLDTCRQSDGFQRLMKLLDGYPLLLIQVVLANLVDQTPGQVLEALKKGGVVQDSKIQEKTEGIMLCIGYSHGNLDADDQKLLMVLAPFTSVVCQLYIEKYIEHLEQQPALKDLPFQRIQDVLQQAQDWGLVTADRIPGYLRLQPMLPYFLRTRLNELPDLKQAVEMAYRAHYYGLAGMISKMITSKDAHEKQVGLVMAGMEYENHYTALEMDLEAKGFIFQPYNALSRYLDLTHDKMLGLEMSQKVLTALKDYPVEALKGQIGVEMAAVVEDIAKRKLSIKRFAEAEDAYKIVLELLKGLTAFDTKGKMPLMVAAIYDQLGMLAHQQRQWKKAEEYYHKALQMEVNDLYRQAGTYHNLGVLAQDQKQWKEAEEYYHKALEIKIEFKDRYGQASTYGQLGRLSQEQEQWKQSEDYYQNALQIFIEFNDRFEQGRAYHNLGNLALQQTQLEQAEEYYEKAIQIFIEFNDEYEQANNYRMLGILAQEKEHWKQAEEYYHKAISTFIEYDDRDSQASIYLQLGILAQEQNNGSIARENMIKALEIFVGSQDPHNIVIAIRNLARLWRATADPTILTEVARILGITQEDAKELLEGRVAED